jgi:hypothetical protein
MPASPDDSSLPAGDRAAPRGDGASKPAPHPPALERIEEALRGLRFGSVLAIVQDGVVVQIERTEKLRLASR